MCAINSAVVRAFRPEARAKTGEVSPLTIGGCALAPSKARTSGRCAMLPLNDRREGLDEALSPRGGGHDPEGDVVFRPACKMGLEGIVSRYRSGRSPDWLKFKNPAAPAVRR
jgi:hypothetical protein